MVWILICGDGRLVKAGRRMRRERQRMGNAAARGWAPMVSGGARRMGANGFGWGAADGRVGGCNLQKNPQPLAVLRHSDKHHLLVRPHVLSGVPQRVAVLRHHGEHHLLVRYQV